MSAATGGQQQPVLGLPLRAKIGRREAHPHAPPQQPLLLTGAAGERTPAGPREPREQQIAGGANRPLEREY